LPFRLQHHLREVGDYHRLHHLLRVAQDLRECITRASPDERADLEEMMRIVEVECASALDETKQNPPGSLSWLMILSSSCLLPGLLYYSLRSWPWQKKSTVERRTRTRLVLFAILILALLILGRQSRVLDGGNVRAGRPEQPRSPK
jgi:hypothetical protein